MKKNAYIKPAMQVVMLKQKYSMLAGSEGGGTPPEEYGGDEEYLDAN